MHHTKLKKANKLIAGITDADEQKQILIDNEFTEDEIKEILAGGSDDDDEEEPETKPAKKDAKAKGDHYEEWRCEIVKGADGSRKVEKLRKLRPCVKITDEEADTLNASAKDTPHESHVIMYFKPE